MGRNFPAFGVLALPPDYVQFNMTDIQAVVAEYVSCLIAPDPGFACPLAASIMTADYVYSRADGSRSYAPKNYVGVLQNMPDIQVRQASPTVFFLGLTFHTADSTFLGVTGSTLDDLRPHASA